MSTESVRRQTLVGGAFILLGTSSIQTASAIVEPAFKTLGPGAACGWRFLLGGLLLLAWARPSVRGWTKEQWRAVVACSVASTIMSFFFYQAIERMPLGNAVAIEYLGPFVVAAMGRRSWRHMIFLFLAAAGVLALTRPGSGLHVVAVIFAALAALGYGLYVVTTHKMSLLLPGIEGLSMSIALSALLVSPFIIASGGVVVHHPSVIGRMAIVAFIAIGLGFGFEMRGLKRLRPSTAGVLLALDPALAFLSGLLFLSQRLQFWDMVGLVCVIVASVGVTIDSANSTAVVG
jgi:inner membrane transporter RhtA